MRQKLFLPLAMVMLMQCWVQPASTLSKSARQDADLGRLAIAAFHTKEYEACVGRWKQLMRAAEQKDPGGMWHAVALRNLAELYFNHEEFEKAKGCLLSERDILVKIDPEFADLAYDYLYLGRIAYARQEFKLADKYLNDGLAIVRLRPCDRSLIPDLLTYCAATAQIQNDHARAEKYLAELKVVLMDKAASNGFLQCAYQLERSSGGFAGAAGKAVNVVEDGLLKVSVELSGLSGFQREAFALYNRLNVYGTSGRRNKEAYQLGLDLAAMLERNAPHSAYQIATAYTRAASMANSIGLKKEANDAWLKALAYHKKLKDHKDEMAEVVAMLGISATLPGNYKKVEEYGLKALSLNVSQATRIELLRCLTCAYENLNNEVARVRYLSMLEQSYSGGSQWRTNLLFDASQLTGYGAPRSASDLVDLVEKRSVASTGKSAIDDVRIKIAQRFFAMGDQESCFRAMKGVVNPTNKAHYCDMQGILGMRCLSQGRPKEAQKHFEEQLAKLPADKEQQRKQAFIYFRLGLAFETDRQFHKAEEQLNKLVAMAEKGPLPVGVQKFHVYRMLSDCAYYQGDEKRALQLARQVLEAAEADSPTSVWISEVYYSYLMLRLKRYAEAEQMLLKAQQHIAKHPDPAGIWPTLVKTYLAISLMEQGQLGKALVLLQSPLPKGTKTNPWVNFRDAVKGRILSLSGKHSEAQKIFSTYVKTSLSAEQMFFTSIGTALYWQGLDWLEQKQSVKAERCFSSALKAYDPYLQYIYEFRDDCATALEAVRK